MKMFAAALLALCTTIGHDLQAQSSPVVVELFTSQGCSSCPPADKLLHDLADRDDVLPLALHVDYWDYIGWKDSFARADHTERQRGYAHAGGRKMIYTPQMIINGQDDVVGAHAMEMSALIARHQAAPRLVALTVRQDGAGHVLEAEALETIPGPITVLLVRYSASRTVEITRGENAGRTLDYANVVGGWRVLGQWDGTAPLAMPLDLEGAEKAAVLLQYPGPGAIVAAARVD